MDVVAAEVHVEAGVAQRADLVLLARLGLDELLDVGVVDVEHDHLGRATGRAAGLDRARGRVGAAHERDRAGRGAAGESSSLDERIRERLRPAPEPPLKIKPSSLYQLRIESIESSTARMKQARDLLRRLGADVEPDRAVERETWCSSMSGQLVLEDLGVLGRGEVAVVLAGLGVGLHDPVDRAAAGSTRARRCRPRRGSTWW